MFLKDILFPKVCLGCWALGSYICSSCEQKLKLIEIDTCLYCRKKSYAGLTHPGCKKRNGIDGLICFYHYNGFFQKIIKHVKYRLVKDVFEEFRQIIQPEIKEKLLFYKRLTRNGLLQCVPLSSIKQKTRGFNQVFLIGSFFNVILQLPVIDYFDRVKKTPPQAEMQGKKERYQNIRKAFKKKRNVTLDNAVVLIVDDVVTSGLTLQEFARTIKKAGASKVYAIALAKG